MLGKWRRRLFFSETGYFLGRWEGVPNTSVFLRRDQYRKADDPDFATAISRSIIKAKVQNCRTSLLRSAREADNEAEKVELAARADELSVILRWLDREANSIQAARGFEGRAASVYFGAFSLMLRWQRDSFAFTGRTRRPPRDRINCLLSFLYALVRHDCIAALTATGLDPFVGYLHAGRPNRPSLALDLMEEFRPAIADRLAITLINRKQINKDDFIVRDGGAVEFTDNGRKNVIAAYQTRKQDTLTHPLLNEQYRYGQLMLVQSRLLARHIRGDLPEYIPFQAK